MAKIIDFINPNNEQQGLCEMKEKAQDLTSVADDILSDARDNISQLNKLSMPISQLSTLGAGVASMLPAFRTVTQTTSVNTAGHPKCLSAFPRASAGTIAGQRITTIFPTHRRGAANLIQGRKHARFP